MHPDTRWALAAVVALTVAANAACADDETASSSSSSSSSSGAGGHVQGPPVSGKANVRFKRNLRLRDGFAQALSLDPNEVCNELGQYACADFVHAVALGGVDPYASGINVPFADTTATTSLAVDRVAISACAVRTARDFDHPGSAAIWKGVDVDGQGRLADPEAAAVAAALGALYTRTVQRKATATEIAALQGLYPEVETSGAEAPARDWATLSCFAVLTTMESLFY